MPPSLPEVIGKYRIERFIESGGMGDVYLARDPSLDRPVAIKFLREGFDSQEMRERFEREARAAGRLSHPNIVTIYEFGEFASRPFIAMEFVRGEPLSRLVRRREPIPLVRKLEMMEGLCSGLGHAHKAGIVHRDIKPANLMVDADGPLKILDFGIVRMAGSGLTSHGVLVGTVNYMSPEQISGTHAIDSRSDVFAVGAVLYEIFTYQRAFPGEMADVLYRIVHTQPEPAATLVPGLDPAIVRAIELCLDKVPERRYQDLSTLRRELGRLRQRLELEEPDASTHTVPTMRPATDSPASRPSGSGPRTPMTPSAERERLNAEAERIRQARIEEERIANERAEQRAREEAERHERERFARERAEQAERERLAREQAEQAERERLARQQAERAERERLLKERAEHERLERERIEEADRARVHDEARRVREREEAERARLERERAEEARLVDARKAREEAERKRAEEQQRARLEAERQAEQRRQQQQQAVANARQAVAEGRFAEAVKQLQPWKPGATGDAAFAAVLAEAQAGLERLQAQQRAQEALERQIVAAAEALRAQDFKGASRIVQEILRAHPNHAGARNLEREIVRAVELQARATTTVERARAAFEASPGDALELLEHFVPPHPIVDAALAELRGAHAARERERLRREARERRQQALGAVVAGAANLARRRAVQGAVAALLVVVVGVASWRWLRPDPGALDQQPDPIGELDPNARKPPDEPRIDPVPPDGQTPSGPDNQPAGRTRPDPNQGRKDPQAAGRRDPIVPTDDGPRGASDGIVEPAEPRRDGQPAGNARADDGKPDQPEPGRPQPGDTTKPERVDVPDDPVVKPEATPEPRRDPTPAAPDPVAVARAEIQQWMAEYKRVYESLDARRAKAMNAQSNLSPADISAVTVDFLKPEIDVAPDGKSAALKGSIRYRYTWKRRGLPPESTAPISWRMKKVGSGWVAN